jgi:hypothetical protein
VRNCLKSETRVDANVPANIDVLDLFSRLTLVVHLSTIGPATIEGFTRIHWLGHYHLFHCLGLDRVSFQLFPELALPDEMHLCM